MFPAGQKLEDSLGNELYLGSKPNYIKPPGEASQPRYWSTSKPNDAKQHSPPPTPNNPPSPFRGGTNLSNRAKKRKNQKKNPASWD